MKITELVKLKKPSGEKPAHHKKGEAALIMYLKLVHLLVRLDIPTDKAVEAAKEIFKLFSKEVWVYFPKDIPQVRNQEIFRDYKALKAQGMRPTEIYSELAIKYRLSESMVKIVIRNGLRGNFGAIS